MDSGDRWKLGSRAEIWNAPAKEGKEGEEGMDAGACVASAFGGLPPFPELGLVGACMPFSVRLGPHADLARETGR